MASEAPGTEKFGPGRIGSLPVQARQCGWTIVAQLILTLSTSETFVIVSIVRGFFGVAVLTYAQAFLQCRIFEKYE